MVYALMQKRQTKQLKIKENGKCEKCENCDKKTMNKKSKFSTPREVKSQDDDVETVVQTIEDDEPPVSFFSYIRI